MFHKYNLKPAVWHQNPLEFEWNAESGEVRGPDADKVLGLVASAMKEGSLIGHPYPTSFEISDPLHNAGEMAVLLGNDWMLPDDLASAYPKTTDDEDVPVFFDEQGVEHSMLGQEVH